MISIEFCPVADVLASHDLIADYAVECSIPAIGEINPQHNTYAAMENAGVLQSFMVLDDARKVGFAIVLTPVLPHYGKKIATLESLFVAKGSRSSNAGRELMREVEKYAESIGCVGILYSAPAGGQLEGLLNARREYERTNSVFYRSLS